MRSSRRPDGIRAARTSSSGRRPARASARSSPPAGGPPGAPPPPPPDLADAVAASCAIPGFYHPVRIGRRRYVDGGVCSVSNLDVLAGEDLDLVICLNPSSSRTPNGGPMGAMRAANGRRLGHEARKLRAPGPEAVLGQPPRADPAATGSNPLSRPNPRPVIATP